MKKRYIFVVLCLLVTAALWLRWSRPAPHPLARQQPPTPTVAAAPVAPAVPVNVARNNSTLNTNKFAFRLANSTNSLAWLTKRAHAVLLENALIDTEIHQGLPIPEKLKHHGAPGAYIVEARNTPNAQFRALLTWAGGQIVSYIPNNAYLVQLDPAGAATLGTSPLVQAVLPYEPYYKIQSSLLGLAVNDQPLPGGTALTLGVFPNQLPAVEKLVTQSGGQVVGQDTSPFGTILRVEPPADWTALAQLPGVELVEVAHRRTVANDLSRVTLGISVDTVTNANYLNLSGSNVLVEINDTGVDTNHPDFTIGGSAATGPGTPSRVNGDSFFSMVDTNGHGTFVAGEIIGNGAESYTLNTNEPQGSVTNADYRGKAPSAYLYSVKAVDNLDPFAISDYYLQSTPAQTNALISNNSWGYGEDGYDLAAASYDAATRDALPRIPGSQPVLFVFAAGNDGGGDNDGYGGSGDTISSPGTAKNVLTVGALEQPRYITNIVTDANSNQVEYWYPQTDSSSQVAFYSSCGNVGIGTEGAYGRFKPDVVLPGTMVVSTRSGQWDTNAYYSPTNSTTVIYPDQTVAVGGLNDYNVSVPVNAVGVVITIVTNQFTTVFPANLPIYFNATSLPTTNNATFTTTKDGATLPADGGSSFWSAVVNGGFWFAIGNSTNAAVNYDVTVQVLTTNNVGNYEQVLEGMNDKLAPYYRYESGTSMAAGAASGTLALIQDYFTNQLHTLPSPALMKALLINGSRPTGDYTYAITNGVNYSGWGLPNIQDVLPFSSTNSTVSTNGPIFFVDQSPTNALATGDSHTYTIFLDTNNFVNYFLNLQVTLAWTDPPGNPASAIKLVNGLELIVTNLDTGDVFYGNDFPGDANFNNPWVTNTQPNIDYVNNVQNVILAPLLGGRYSITVFGRSVNVNAVTAQTNNVVQDYALVVTCGEGEDPTAITSVTDNGLVTNPTGDQDITSVTTTNSPLFNQIVGASTPLLATNTLPLGPTIYWGTNGAISLGMTNQWHFYIVTNNVQTTGVATNAVFLTFLAGNLSLPRMGVFADSDADSTRPSPGINLFATTDPGITNLNPTTISNCVFNVGDNKSDLALTGTEFVYFTDSTPGQVYYVAVQAQDQMGAEYDFMPIFTSTPLSQNNHGNLQASGLLLPGYIPDGDPAHPGVTNVFALAIPGLANLSPTMQIANVVVTNQIWHQNFGDLFGVLQSPKGTSVALNDHDGLGNTYGTAARVYNDSRVNTNGTVHTDAPGTGMQAYNGQQAIGPWIQYQMDNALTHTGQIQNFTLTIQPHQNFQHPGITVIVPAGGWFLDYVQVPVGYEQLILDATNVTAPYASQAIQFYEMYNQEPSATSYDQEVLLTNCLTGIFDQGGYLPGNSISTGPPLPAGFYYVALYNPNNVDQSVFLDYTLVPVPVIAYVDTNGPATGISADTVNQSTVFVSSTQQIAAASVGVVIQNARMSDLALTLVNDTTGQRILLMENRGGPNTVGAGGEFVYTNVLNATATGGAAANTNYFNTGNTFGTIPITYNMYTVPDEMTVYYGTNITPQNLILDTGMVNNPGGVPTTISVTYPPPGATTVNSTYLTIIMNQNGNTNAINGDAWTYTIGATVTNYQYLVFTDDTNLTTIPIAYAIPPYQLSTATTNYTFSDLDTATNGTYVGPTNVYDPYGGWTVPTNLVTVTTVITNGALVSVTNNVPLTNNEVSVVTDPSETLEPGSNYLALANGLITRQLPTVPGYIYNVTYWYRGPGIDSWWRGEGNGLDSSDPENNANNGDLIGRFTFPSGEVNQAFGLDNPGQIFVFAGTNAYVQIPQPPSLLTNSVNGTNQIVQTSPLDVGTRAGFTVEGWINPTNLGFPQPVLEWLARVPTNTAVTNLVVKAGPFLSPVNRHYYYLLGTNDYTTSEYLARQLGGHLATVRNANEQNWIYDEFGNYGGYNHNLWIGLTNSGTGFGWTSGETNAFVNWRTGQPANPDAASFYTVLLGSSNNPANLWALADNNGYSTLTPSNRCYGVVEVSSLQPIGVQLWVSLTNSVVTNSAGASVLVSSNGCLYANLVDATNGNHEIISPGGLIQSNIYQHIALTYNTNSGFATLYYNGTNVASTNLGVFIPKTTGDVLLGKDLSLRTNNAFFGELDEISVYGRLLSPAEILAIYQCSALSTNRLIGKFDPAVTPAVGLAEAVVTINGTTNEIYGFNDDWALGSYTFTATNTYTTVQVQGLEPGILLNDFAVSQAPLTNLYYLPETSLDALNGDNANGNWTLEVWDTRTNSPINSQLVSWQLQFTVATNPPVTLSPEGLVTNTIPANSIAYYAVAAPAWAAEATNTIVSATTNVDLLYNQTALPQGNTPPDYELLPGMTSGSSTLLAVPPAPYFIPGSTYYLGVRNTSAVSATVVLSVDFNIIALTNDVPYTNTLTTNSYDTAQFYVFNVASNAYAATFQLLKLSSNADLVVSAGAPLPTLTNCAYGSFNVSNANQNIYVLTNSTPVPLTPGPWYLGVYRRTAGPVHYSVLAQETTSNAITVINLTNNVPFNYTAGPGAALTNFFCLAVTNRPPSVHFELYNLSGNGDLTVQTNALPLAPPFLQSSTEPGRTPELIYVTTNNVLTNLAASWYLGVPNNETHPISFTILAVIDTNANFPAFPGAEGAGAGAGDAGVNTGSAGLVYHMNNVTNVYHVTSLADDGGTNELRYGLSLSNCTVVFDVSGTINLTNGPLVITNSFLTLAGQTAPGDGITLAGKPFILSSAHDIVLRYLRFRLGDIPADALQFTNTSDVIADHVSISWSDNNLLSVLNSTNVTVQWSILANSLFNASAPVNAGTYLAQGGGIISLHHNLYANNYTGTPQLNDNLSLDFVNNVVYNWGLFSGLSEAANTVTNQLNYACNYLIAGLNTSWYGTNYAITNIAFWGGTTNTWIFQTNNLIDSNTNGLLDGGYTGWSMFTNNFTRSTNRIGLPWVGTDDAYLAYDRVLDFAGTAMQQRDQEDLDEVHRVEAQSGRFVPTGSPLNLPVLNSAFAWPNSSGDGIPDFWKQTFGWLPVTNSYNTTPTTNVTFIGYTVLEEYLAWLAGPHALTSTNQPVTVDLRRLSGGRMDWVTFTVTNAINGTVYLTNDPVNPLIDPNTGLTNGTIAVFVPTNGYSGYASFDYSVTNYQNVVITNSTTNALYNAFVGPMTVSVVVSADSVSLAPINLAPNEPQTNLLGANSIGWYEVTVPTNAIFATNALLAATGPNGIPALVNLWWSTNVPPSTNGLTDVELVTNAAAGTNAILGIDTTPALVPGTTYYFGVQNTNPFGITSVVELTFDYLSSSNGVYLRNLPNIVVPANTLMTVTNTAYDFYPSNVVYTLTNSPLAVGSGIDTNGIITWTPTTNNIGTNYTFTTIATDTNTLLSATNSFTVLVLPGAPNGSGQTNVVGANSISWYVVQVPNIAYASTNSLISESLPLNLWWSTNLPPSITNSTDAELLTNTVNGVSILTLVATNNTPALNPGGQYYLGIQNTNNVAVTNVLEVTFALPPAPVLPNLPSLVLVEGTPLTVTNTATDTNAVTYAFTTAPTNGATISTNGIITWLNTTNTAGTNYLFTTIATDTVNGQTATNSFYVVVVSTSFLGGGPQTNVVGSNSISWYLVQVPTNALAATNTLLYASLPVNLWWSTNLPPSIDTNAGDFELLTNAINGTNVITTNTNSQPQLVAGKQYLLGVQNTNSVAITNVLDVTFELSTLQFSIGSIVPATRGGTNGYLITWETGTNYQFHLLWSSNLMVTGTVWHPFPGVISYTNLLSPGLGQFQFFDDGSRSGGLGSNRFYRLLLLKSPTNTAPYWVTWTNTIPNQFVPFGSSLVLTNLASDWDIPVQTLTYGVVNSLPYTNAPVITNGVILWTPNAYETGTTNEFTTTVTDNGVQSKSISNIVYVYVPAFATPVITNVVASAGSVTLQWSGLTGQPFNVRYTTNLVPPVFWTNFPGTVTSGNGVFSFVDTNATAGAKFYQLVTP